MYSVNSYSSISSRKGLGGLMSGLDTDELVKQMTTTTRVKIATQLQKKQVAQWQQTAYQEIISKINNFQNKFLTYSAGKNNILSNTFFKTSTIKNTSSYVNITGDTNAAKNFVLKDIVELAETSRFSTTKKLSDQALTTGIIAEEWTAAIVAGAEIDIQLDNKTHKIALSKDFAFSSNSLTDEQKINEIVAEINKSISKNDDLVTKDGDGNITSTKINFSYDGNAISVANSSGESIKIKDGDSGLLAGLGLEKDSSGATIVGTSLDTTKLFEQKILKDALSGSSMTFSFNGISKTITFNESEKDSFQDAQSLSDYLQGKLNTAFGNGKVNVTNDDGKLKFTTADTTSTFSIVKTDAKGIMGKNGALGIEEGSSNRVKWNVSLKDLKLADNITAEDGKFKLTINDTAFEFSEDETLNDILTAINNSEAGVNITYSTTMDTFSVTSKESGVHGRVDVQDSGDSNDLAYSLFGSVSDRNIVAGKDAQIVVSFDGGLTTQNISRASNSFSLDGLNIELLGKAEGTEQENIKLTVDNNSEELVDKIKGFIQEYNDIIKFINDQISEKKVKGMTALTDEQKEEMTEKQIEKWEADAKKGLLSNDLQLSGLLTKMRNAMGSLSDGSNFSLSKMGITTKDWRENGQLHIDEDKLRKAITDNFDDVVSLFTKLNEDDPKKAGIATKLSNVLNAAAGTFGGDGFLIRLAGKPNSSVPGQDILTLRIRRMDSQLNLLKTKLQTEEDRYYKQFTTLETYLSKMSAQSSWLNDLNGGQN